MPSSSSLALAFGAGAAATFVITLMAKKTKKAKKIRVKYFPVAATPGEKLRIALCLTVGKDGFEDDRLVKGTWDSLKPKMKYQQLPVLYLDDVEYHQSGAALRYIGANLGDGSLYPINDPEALMKIEEMIGLLEDFQNAWMPCLYVGMRPAYLGHDPSKWTDEEKAAKIKEMREKFITTALPKYLGYLSRALEEAGDGGFLAGSKISIADCQALPQLNYFTRGVADHVPSDCLNAFPAITAYLERMKTIPAIKEFMVPK